MVWGRWHGLGLTRLIRLVENGRRWFISSTSIDGYINKLTSLRSCINVDCFLIDDVQIDTHIK